jgi:hypothetical protein
VPERLELRGRARLEAGLGIRPLWRAALVDARVRRLCLEDLDVLTRVHEVSDRLEPSQVRIHRALQLGLGLEDMQLFARDVRDVGQPADDRVVLQTVLVEEVIGLLEAVDHHPDTGGKVREAGLVDTDERVDLGVRLIGVVLDVAQQTLEVVGDVFEARHACSLDGLRPARRAVLGWSPGAPSEDAPGAIAQV